MKKEIRFSSVSEIHRFRDAVIEQAGNVAKDLNRLSFSQDSALDLIRRLKFERTVDDRVFDERMNFVEYLNQTFTYLVCLCAGETVLNRFGYHSVLVRFGTAPGYDIEAGAGELIGECFSATSVKSNSKLKTDILRLCADKSALKRCVFFYSEGSESDRSYIEKMRFLYPSVTLIEFDYSSLQGKSRSDSEER